MDNSEQELVRAAAGDPEAFGELYRRYLPRVYSYAYYRTGSVADAEDLAARVFLQALTHLPAYTEHGAPFAAWLFRIAHNLVANWYRDRSRHPTVPLDVVEMDAPEAPGLEAAEEKELVRRAVALLSAERQNLIALKFVADLSNAEIARALGRSEGAVKALLHRTLDSLRQRLAEMDETRKENGDGPVASSQGGQGQEKQTGS